MHTDNTFLINFCSLSAPNVSTDLGRSLVSLLGAQARKAKRKCKLGEEEAHHLSETSLLYPKILLECSSVLTASKASTFMRSAFVFSDAERTKNEYGADTDLPHYFPGLKMIWVS